MDLREREVHVWLVALDDRRLGSDQRLLSAAEQERAARFKFDEHRNRFVIAHTALRRILAGYLEVEPQELEFREGAQGKPALVLAADQSPLAFNLSHSHEAALIAVTLNREIGVDIEYMKPDFDWQSIVENFFAPGEIARLNALPSTVQRAAFFACWTRKESYIKAKGGGLSIPLREFEVSVEPGGPAALLACSNDLQEVKRWAMANLDVGPRYAAAVCVEAPLISVQYLTWNPKTSPV